MTPTLFPAGFQICSLSSGSSGNCYYIGSSEEGILVDAGISARRIRKTLEEIGLGFEQIKGVLITHSHIDHIQALTILTKKHRLPVYCTKGTWSGILRNRTTFDLDRDMFVEIVPKTPFRIATLSVEAFAVSHDAPDAVGYHIRNSERSLTLATDLGHIGEDASSYLLKANVVVLESNYDEQMLLSGRYPEHLKQRVHGPMGHLCNAHASNFLAQNYHHGISHILLGHLSAENNTPSVALQTLDDAFNRHGNRPAPHTIIRALPRGKRSELFVID